MATAGLLEPARQESGREEHVISRIRGRAAGARRTLDAPLQPVLVSRDAGQFARRPRSPRRDARCMRSCLSRCGWLELPVTKPWAVLAVAQGFNPSAISNRPAETLW